MKYLLDTHIVLWFAENSSKLSDSAKTIILDETNEKYVSIASCWEVSIKLSLNKMELIGGTAEFFRVIQENGFTLLPVMEEHLIVLEKLPFQHRDPFDRLLVATAMVNQLVLLMDDAQLKAYATDKLSVTS